MKKVIVGLAGAVGLIALTLLGAVAPAVAAPHPVGSDFRISNVGTDGDPERGGFEPAVAFDSASNEYLVTWRGDGLATEDEFEIFGHRLASSDATTTALACTPSSLELGGSSTCVVTATDTGAAAKAPSGQIKFASDSPGAFSGTGSCVLAIAGTARSSCRITYSPSAVGAGSGTHRLSATYGGDETHLESHGLSQVTVVQATVLTAPQTKILTKPHQTTANRNALFTFVADQPGSSFQCSLDKRAFRPCRSPLKVRKLNKGSHVFRVKAISPQGIADPTPAVFRWKVSASAGRR